MTFGWVKLIVCLPGRIQIGRSQQRFKQIKQLSSDSERHVFKQSFRIFQTDPQIVELRIVGVSRKIWDPKAFDILPVNVQQLSL